MIARPRPGGGNPSRRAARSHKVIPSPKMGIFPDRPIPHCPGAGWLVLASLGGLRIPRHREGPRDASLFKNGRSVGLGRRRLDFSGLGRRSRSRGPGRASFLPGGGAFHLLQGLAGLALILLPMARRVFQRICDPGDVVEFHNLALALRRVGLGSRVNTINLYLGDRNDEAWRAIFASEKDLWDWLARPIRMPGCGP